MALLAACDHTIVSQGLFGTWGGFLAGGDVYSTYGVMVREVLTWMCSVIRIVKI